MDWKTASKTQAAFLEHALDVCRHAIDLGQLAQARQAGVREDDLQRMKQGKDAAEKLMRRLNKGEFRIAVVGMEKAGKSTFVNAWLGCDLLPAKTERCTFTTTQIYSVGSDTEQRLETQPKTAQAFAEYQNDLHEQCASANTDAKERAEKDLNVIQAHELTLREAVNEGTRTIRFARLDDIKADLDKYVADQRYAHAMQEARLYTKELAAIDGVVFFDVPGLDSGLAKHVEETKAILADCDAIVVIQNGRFINLKAHEQDVIKYGETGDKYLSLADKLFVFWGQIDLKASREVLLEEWVKLCDEWQRFNIPKNRIVYGSAGAHLVLHGYTIREIGHVDSVRNKMRELMGVEDDDALKAATGISELKTCIQRYLNEERTALLQRRVNAMLHDLLEPAKEMYLQVKRRYPEDVEQAMRSQQDQRNILFSEWWGRCWDTIKADLKNNFDERRDRFIALNLQANEGGALQRRYCDLVTEIFTVLPTRQSAEIEKIFDGLVPTFDPQEANIEWRKRLYKDTRKAIEMISQQLAIELQKEAKELVAGFRTQLWNSDVSEVLLKPNYLESLEGRLETLFLRFARPIAELLIRGPLGSDTREHIRREIGSDVEIIDNYYQGDEPALRRVGRYANHGARLLHDSELRKRILGDAAAVAKFILKRHPLSAALLNVGNAAATIATEMKMIPSATIAHKKQSVIDEVEADVQTLEHYLLNGVFEAAGLMQFAQQELEKLRDDFLDKKDTWGGMIRNEWEKGNPLLLQEMPMELQQQRFDTEVSDKLKQLGIALQQMNCALDLR